jgi:hypothetical protein
MLFRPLRLPLGALLLAVLLVVAPSARGLTIVTNYIPPGEQIPGVGVATAPAANVRGGGTLQTVFRAAADAWERAIRDEFTLTVNYGWIPTAAISATAYHQGLTVGGTPSRETAGSIVFNGSPARPFFLDPTPYEHEEFGPMTVAASDLGGGPINIRREYLPANAMTTGAIDLLSTAVHELGHALGLAGWPFFTAETGDGDIDVTIAPYAGMQIPVSSTHLNVIGPAMSSTGRPIGYRRAITDLDLIAVSAISQFEQFVLSPSADFNGDWLVNQLDLKAWSAAFAAGALADADGNGVTDGADFLAWQRQVTFDPAPEKRASMAIPEPVASTLWATLLLLVTGRCSQIDVISCLTARRTARAAETARTADTAPISGTAHAARRGAAERGRASASSSNRRTCNRSTDSGTALASDSSSRGSTYSSSRRTASASDSTSGKGRGSVE